jgi:hypothetical protein
MGCVVNATPRLLYPWERDPVPIVKEGGWAPGQVWTGAENLASTGIRSPPPFQPVACGYTVPENVLVPVKILMSLSMY